MNGKRWLALMLAVLMVMALVACGDNATSEDPKKTDNGGSGDDLESMKISVAVWDVANAFPD
ncbi:MAG: hypothetical protein PHX55_03060, partial [Eubacteriales bacterium]|nr:hypothetical protein [Eubacteriales bacterium]